MIRHKSDVRDWMTANPVTISPDATLLDAFAQMVNHDVRRLPVVLENELVGMITLSDVQRAVPVAENGHPNGDASRNEIRLSSRTVREFMAATPISIDPDDTIQDAAETMLEYQVSGLPVVQGEEVVGIITESDIFRLVVESWSTVFAD
ncbi:CBS domain-containing protein [Chloroflexi bacterium TSY]|nr:CBS domain-containing protein [Chloroflexi bacterium TSY]